MLRLKRVYEEAEEGDGFRILVDRLWPRGVSKEDAALDLWLKEVAPSDPLRRWFSHDPSRWEEFKESYFRELEGKEEELNRIRSLLGEGDVTLLFASKDKERNNAVALAEYLRKEK